MGEPLTAMSRTDTERQGCTGNDNHEEIMAADAYTCSVEIEQHPLPTYSAHCVEHGTVSYDTAPTAERASRTFICDPTRRRFIVCSDEPGDSGEPSVVDLGGLVSRVQSTIELADHFDSDLKMFRWNPRAPQLLEPLVSRLIEASAFDEDDWAWPVYEITTADGAEIIATVRCKIDGRA